MHRRSVTSLILVFFLSLIDALPAEFIPGEALVILKPDVATSAASQAQAARGRFNRTFAIKGPGTFTRNFRGIRRQTGRDCGVFRSPGENTDDLLARLRAHPDVLLAEPNHIRRHMGVLVPEDPRVSDSWHLDNNGRDVDFFAAWRLTKPDLGNVVIGILDTGVDYRHQDLVANMWVNLNEVPGNNLDDDNNGYIDDIYGVDASGDFGAAPDGDPMDAGVGVAHGTHVAGTAAATLGNNLGANGTCPSARIMALKGSPNGDTFTVAGIVDAVDYAIQQKQVGVPICVINASYGGPSFNTFERNAYAAANTAGIIISAAAGNESSNNDTTNVYPANYDLPNLISVAATTSSDTLGGLSNFGTNQVDIAAPGIGIFATRPTHIGSDARVLSGDDSITGNGMIYSGMTDDAGITGTLVFCGLGRPEEFPPEVDGNIAFIQRGELFFSDKVANADAAGAAAVIIFNNVGGNFSGTLQFPSGMNIPAISISDTDGATLSNRVGDVATLINTFTEETAYEVLSGTSMAAPMVSGAIALAAEHFPNDTPTERIQRILDASDVLPSLEGRIAGARRLNLRRILDQDEDTLPDWWELEHAGDLDTLQDPTADPDGDGQSTSSEFLSLTNPLNPDDSFQVDINAAQQVEWFSAPGRIFDVEYTPSLDTPFGPIAGDLPATPPRNIYTPNINTARGFYRVRIQ